jgi:hypothetical protein
MFPTLKVRVSGLQQKKFYAICLQITPYDDKRYRYVYHRYTYCPDDFALILDPNF